MDLIVYDMAHFLKVHRHQSLVKTILFVAVQVLYLRLDNTQSQSGRKGELAMWTPTAMRACAGHGYQLRRQHTILCPSTAFAVFVRTYTQRGPAPPQSKR